MTLAASVVTAAIAKGVTLTTAESCTGGMVSAAITDIAGSSAMFECGFVTYSNTAKSEMLAVDAATLTEFGAVSEAVAAQMATGALRAAHADIAVSVTGIAGPGGSEHKPEGRVCFAVAYGGNLQTITHEFGPVGRANVRQSSVDVALELLKQAIVSL